MKKIYFLLLAAIFACVSASAGKVYFTNPSNWSKVYCHYWGGTSTGTDWPGLEMTKSGDLYEIETVGEPTGIIFNNGAGSQTGNLVYQAGATYDLNGPIGAEKSTFTVNFDNTDTKWSKVCCYTFDGVETGSWPGTEMTKGENNIYTLSFKAFMAPSKVIFHNGSGSQTANLEFEDGATYNLNGKVGTEPQTFVVMFDNAANWEEVYAYAWTGETPLAAYPGTKLTATDGVYMYTFEAMSAPANIQFNNGKEGDNLLKTPDYAFEDGKLYSIPVPKDLFIVGAATEWAKGEQFTRENNTYSLSIDGELKGQFKIYDGSWDYSYGSGLNFTSNPNATEPAGKEVDAWFNSSSNFSFEPATVNEGYKVDKTNIVFVWNPASAEKGSSIASKIKLTYETSSGIEIVAGEEAPAVYYNLQGVRVNNPENGIFIRVSGNKAVKVAL